MSDRISCGIARDLMPLVIDDACGEESRQAVEAHIAGCAECAKVYEAMKVEIPKPAADEQENAHFTQSMKKTRRKTRWIKILCAVLAMILLVTIGYYAANPGSLFSEYTTVPVSWIHNAHLVRTTDGHALLQFTPDQRYKRYKGNQWSRVDMSDARQLTDMTLRFRYPKLAKLLNITPPEQEDDHYGMYTLANGDIAINLNEFFIDWIYTDGKMRTAWWRTMTDEEAEKLYPSDTEPTDQSRLIYDYIPESEYGGKMEMRITDGTDTIVVYDGSQDIPLCDPELDESFRQHSYPSIGMPYDQYSTV